MSARLEEALAHHRAGRLEEAARSYRLALAGAAHNALVSGLLGDVLQALKRDAEAEAAYRDALRLDPKLAIVHMNLGLVLRRQRKLDQAVAAFEEAVRCDPRLPEPRLNLGLVYYESGRFEQAAAAYHRALALRPDYAEAYLNLGAALHAQQRYDEARSAYERALNIRPDYAEAHYSLGMTLFDAGELDDAEAAFRRALAADPAHGAARDGLALILQVMGRTGAAVALYREGVAAGQHAATRYLALCSLYDPDADPEGRYLEERRAEDRFARSLYARTRPHANTPDPERRLRIGYLTSDFRDHPVGRNVEPLIANRDRRRFEVIAYADVGKRDAVTQRFEALVDRWCSIAGLDDEEIAAKIRGDGVDILVLLAAHFDRNRPLVCAYRPAPVQISFHDLLTTGLEVVDYFIADRTVYPKGAGERFTERVIRMPSLYVHAPLPDLPVTPPPSAASGAVTFGSFNNPAKINRKVLASWAEILRSAPHASLLLKFRNWFLVPALQERVRAAMREEGVDPVRVRFAGAPDQMTDHLARYAEVDIALDTFPFSGSTTTFEALWMGVPVVTWAGATVASRWSASMLRALKLDECVAGTSDRYAAIAVGLAGNPGRLAELRSTLRRCIRASPLVDGALRARQVERVYRAVWRRWCERQAGPG